MNLDDLIDFEEKEIETPPEEVIEEVEEPEEISTEEVSEESEESEESSPELEAYYQYLRDNNVLVVPEDYKFDGTDESLNNALELTKRAYFEDVKNQIWEALPDDFKPLIEYGLMNNASLDEYLRTFSPDPLENYDISDPVSQKIVISEYYKRVNPNYDEAKIERMISRLEEIGSLEEEAADALDYIKESRAAERENFLALKQQEEQERLQQAEQYLETIKTAIDSSEYDNLTKGRIKAMLFNPNTQVQEFEKKIQSVYQNPAHLIQLAELLSDYDEKKGFTHDRLKKRLKSESTKKFSSLIEDKLNTKSKLTGSSKKVSEDFDFSEFIR